MLLTAWCISNVLVSWWEWVNDREGVGVCGVCVWEYIRIWLVLIYLCIFHSMMFIIYLIFYVGRHLDCFQYIATTHTLLKWMSFYNYFWVQKYFFGMDSWKWNCWARGYSCVEFDKYFQVLFPSRVYKNATGFDQS